MIGRKNLQKHQVYMLSKVLLKSKMLSRAQGSLLLHDNIVAIRLYLNGILDSDLRRKRQLPFHQTDSYRAFVQITVIASFKDHSSRLPNNWEHWKFVVFNHDFTRTQVCFKNTALVKITTGPELVDKSRMPSLPDTCDRYTYLSIALIAPRHV